MTQDSVLENVPQLKYLVHDYDLESIGREATCGQYLTARSKKTGKHVKIKHIPNVYRDIYFCKRVLRELTFCIELSRDKGKNPFTPQLIDVIMPCVNDSESIKSRAHLDHQYSEDKVSDETVTPTKRTALKKLKEIDFTCDSVFLVFDSRGCKSDLKHLMKSTLQGTRYDEENIVVIIYNSLLCLKYLHQNGIIHRDIKPSNLLVDKNCEVRLANFSMARKELESSKLMTI